MAVTCYLQLLLLQYLNPDARYLYLDKTGFIDLSQVLLIKRLAKRCFSVLLKSGVWIKLQLSLDEISEAAKSFSSALNQSVLDRVLEITDQQFDKWLLSISSSSLIVEKRHCFTAADFVSYLKLNKQ